jgi:hypothetical protein
MRLDSRLLSSRWEPNSLLHDYIPELFQQHPEQTSGEKRIAETLATMGWWRRVACSRARLKAIVNYVQKF